MKVNDIQPLVEAIVNVPKSWVSEISNTFKQPLIYAYAYEFSDSVDEKQELLAELGFNPMGQIETIATVVDSKNKLVILRKDMPLVDRHDETYIGDTEVTLVAQYAPNSNNKGGYSTHPTYGNLLIINIAGFIADGDELETPQQELNDIMRSLENVIEHELVHLIQRSKNNTKQLKKNKGYELTSVGKTKEYFKSPVEFNAMITTFIRDIEKQLDMLSQEQKSLLGYDNLMNGIRYSMGDHTSTYKETGNKNIDMKGYPLFADIFKQSPFMLTLQDHKPNSWKKAVKAVAKHFENTL